MQKRLIIAIILAVIFMIAYQQLVMDKYKKQPVTTEQQSVKSVEKQTKIDKEQTKDEVKKVEEQSEKYTVPKKIKKTETIADTSKKTFKISNNLFTATFSNQGAYLKSFQLKKHKNEEGNPYEIVSEASAKHNIFPFMIRGEGEEIFNDKNFKASKKIDKNKVTTIEFIFDDGEGNRALKKFTIRENTYLIEIKTYFSIEGNERELFLIWGPGISADKAEDARFSKDKIAFFKSDKVEDIDINDIKEIKRIDSEKWVAYNKKYFTALFLSNSRKLEARVDLITENKEEEKYLPILMIKNIEKAFIGPKELHRLKKIGHKAEDLIHYGLFGFLSKILLQLLLFAHGIIPNFGFAIIIVTLILKIVLLPLTYSSSISMAKMQELQPQVKKIQRKYKKYDKKDLEKRKQMNQEMMELYKKNKVNPAGGCLPLLIQLPFLWGFYRALWVSIEIRHEPFILWITDLSQKDPLYILPILMGVSQIFMQKMTPSSGAQKNQKFMTYGMAIFMTLIFLNFPSGLVLYWFTNNILHMIQQFFVNKQLAKRKQ